MAEKRPASATDGGDSAQERRKKRKSRWGDEDDKVELPGIVTTLPSSMTKEQQECYMSMFCRDFFCHCLLSYKAGVDR